MARTDDDSWDITESVGATALGVAWARSQESTSECPLYTDPYAEVFIEEAITRGWELPQRHMAERIRSISGYAASRTKWFDEFFIAAGAGGIEQAVILAAGLDARAWRLPWNDGSVVYEIDQPKVLAFKSETLHAHGARSRGPLRGGTRRPPARLAEGIAGCGIRCQQADRMGGRGAIALPTRRWSGSAIRAHRRSQRPGQPRRGGILRRRVLRSRVPGEPSRTDAPTAGRSGRDRSMTHPTSRISGTSRTAPTSATGSPAHGWEVSTIDAADLMQRYNRSTTEDTTPRTVFVEAKLTATRRTAETRRAR